MSRRVVETLVKCYKKHNIKVFLHDKISYEILNFEICRVREANVSSVNAQINRRNQLSMFLPVFVTKGVFCKEVSIMFITYGSDLIGLIIRWFGG